MEYPAEAGLAGGAQVMLEVEAFGANDRLRGDETAFRVATDSEAASVRSHLTEIARAAGGDDTIAGLFLSACYLVDLGYYEEAQHRFEALSRLIPDDPAPHKALADVYEAVGLADLAKTELQRGLELTSGP